MNPKSRSKFYKKKREGKEAACFVSLAFFKQQVMRGYAARYTFIISLYFMVGLLHYTVFGVGFLGLPELKALPALLLSITVIIALYLGLRWYFNKKEDIE